MSTPLNTIFLVLNDLLQEKNIQNDIHIKKEIDLLKSQADRCRDILLTLSKNPENLKDNFFDKNYLSNIVKINFEKFKNDNIKLQIKPLIKNEEPKIIIKDEIVYAIGNIIQNAIQHSKNIVNAEILWNNFECYIVIKDDGVGFSREILDKIGQPYISKKVNGMGLGIL